MKFVVTRTSEWHEDAEHNPDVPGATWDGKRWTVEVPDVATLVAIVDSELPYDGRVVISHSDGEWGIEMYDDYRE